jgi:hypothetical protein
MRKGGVNTQLSSGEQHVISAEKARLKALIKSARQGLELTPVSTPGSGGDAEIGVDAGSGADAG